MGMPVNTTNVVTAFRDSFEAFTPGEKWNVTTAPGDIIQLDGNALAASYFVISKDPWSADTESVIETTARFRVPFEVSLGLHLSQRTIGQEFSYEIASEETLPQIADIEIAHISQTGTMLTITTTAPHPLRPGQRFGVTGVSDSRLNYSQLVCSAVNANVIYATAGPGGTITSVTAGPLSGGSVYFRPAIGRAANGASAVFEGTNVSTAALYSRADSGDAIPSGAAASTHNVSIGSTASVQPMGTAGANVFQPSNEYRLRLTPEEVNWLDVPVDSTSSYTSRLRRTQVIPSPNAAYKLRLRAVNTKSLSRPIAGIVSVTKTGTTTATVVCDRPHNLTTTSYVSSAGARDTSNFPALTSTVPLSIVDATTFTVAWGSTSTTSSYGGTINLNNGSQPTQGFTAQVVQQADATGGVLRLIGSANWSTLQIGDYVNVAGLIGQSGTLGLDGVYRVREFNGTNLYLEPIGSTAPVADFATINAGGSTIKRSDLRLSWARVLDYERQRVEFAARGGADAQTALNVLTVAGSVTSLGASTNNIGYVGKYSPSLLGTADITSAAITASATTSAITVAAALSQAVTIAVTAVSGTNPTMDVDVEESDDNGANWFKVYSFPRITAVGFYRTPKLPIRGSRVRYVQTIGGTSPSFTRVVNRIVSHDVAPSLAQLIDRTISLTTLNSATPSLDVRNCRNVQMQVLTTAATTAAVLQLEGSDDNGSSWWPIGAALTATANSSLPSVLTVNNVHAGLVRARVSTAGTGVIYSYVLLKGF